MLGNDTGIAGYNVQIAIDTRHHLIVAHEVTNVAVLEKVQSRLGGEHVECHLGRHIAEPAR